MRGEKEEKNEEGEENGYSRRNGFGYRGWDLGMRDGIWIRGIGVGWISIRPGYGGGWFDFSCARSRFAVGGWGCIDNYTPHFFLACLFLPPAELLVLTDFGACPLVEFVRGTGTGRQRKHSFVATGREIIVFD